MVMLQTGELQHMSLGFITDALSYEGTDYTIIWDNIK
jgi:hypothetical protein